MKRKTKSSFPSLNSQQYQHMSKSAKILGSLHVRQETARQGLGAVTPSTNQTPLLLSQLRSSSDFSRQPASNCKSRGAFTFQYDSQHDPRRVVSTCGNGNGSRSIRGECLKICRKILNLSPWKKKEQNEENRKILSICGWKVSSTNCEISKLVTHARRHLLHGVIRAEICQSSAKLTQITRTVVVAIKPSREGKIRQSSDGSGRTYLVFVVGRLLLF